MRSGRDRIGVSRTEAAAGSSECPGVRYAWTRKNLSRQKGMIKLTPHRDIEAAAVHFDALNAVWAGKLHLARDNVEFRTNDESRLQATFEQTVDHYLDTCAAMGRLQGDMEISHEPVVVLTVLQDLAPEQAKRLVKDPTTATSMIYRADVLTAVAAVVHRKRGLYALARGDVLPVLDWYERTCIEAGLGPMDEDLAKTFGLSTNGRGRWTENGVNQNPLQDISVTISSVTLFTSGSSLCPTSVGLKFFSPTSLPPGILPFFSGSSIRVYSKLHSP